MAPIGAKLGQNAFQTIPDVSFFDAEKKIEKCFELWTAVYPSRMAPIDLKLCQNAFQTLPNISCFDVEDQRIFRFFVKKIGWKCEMRVLEELWIFEPQWHIRLEKWPPINLISALYNFWRRGLQADFDFFRWFWAKTDFHLFLMIWWYKNWVLWFKNWALLKTLRGIRTGQGQFL